MRHLTFACAFVVTCIANCGIVTAADISARPQTQPTPLTDTVRDAKGLDQALERLHAPMRQSPALSPREELTKFHPRPGLAVDLIASEPAVRQPVCINFDERGRMWVVQYIQYPFPQGLKVVEYDQYIRAKFDKVPAPPPRGVRGHDRITILEDIDGDGSFRKVKTFVDGLNIATSALPGRGGRGPDDYGVWVMNPPYLLFYPDKNRDDVPDADPIVHLSGFGLQDTHAVASNLTWGPDGWLYGTQGSTTTAKVKVEITGDPKTTDFQGQAIWRYQPETHRFEVFAEGGGNTFGLEFDDAGRAYSGTNTGNYRGLHYVQGGYYIKSWGKHGPLTNPYAFGYFNHMPHTGNADRLSHTFIVYGGGLLGDEYTGKIISPNPLQSRIQVTRLEPLGSSYKTIEEPFMVTCDDGWFRPVDLKAGPDGALYVADFYEQRISHVDPRDTWDRSTGRIWRVRPADWKPGLKPFDLAASSSADLVKRLESKNRWERTIARELLSLRHDSSVVPDLHKMLTESAGQPALDALWAINAVGGFDGDTAVAAMRHPYAPVRMWAVRLLGDMKDKPVDSIAYEAMLDLAGREIEPQVRSQLASTAKRLPASQALPLIRQMLTRDEDAKDVHIPLLLWWAVEDKAVSHRDETIVALSDASLWRHPLARDVVLPRLVRRYAADPTPENQAALVTLLNAAPGDADRAVLLSGIKEGFAGLALDRLQTPLRTALTQSGDPEIALRLGDPVAVMAAISAITDETRNAAQRAQMIQALGELADRNAIPAFLQVAKRSKASSVRKAAVVALGRFDDPVAGRELVALYPKLSPHSELRTAMLSTLLSRPAWTAELLKAIDAGSIARSDLGITQIERIRAYNDPAVASLAGKLFGRQAKPTSQEHANEIARVTRLVTTGTGDAEAGKDLFTARCAVCHTLFGQGAKVGPDLTGYERRNVDFLVLSVVDPSAYIREEYTAFRVRTKGGETLIGLITDRGPNQITLEDAAQQKTIVPKDQILEERALPTSLMPEGLLEGLSDQQVRDLFKYLASDKPPGQNKNSN
jgi:putative membrane-bound dehydrogenase-like protein